MISSEHGYVKTTNEYYNNVNGLFNFLKDEVNENDIFITTIFDSVLYLHMNISKSKNNYYDYLDNERFEKVNEVIINNPQGLIILDSRRNSYWSKGYPLSENFTIENITINTIRNEQGI